MPCEAVGSLSEALARADHKLRALEHAAARVVRLAADLRCTSERWGGDEAPRTIWEAARLAGGQEPGGEVAVAAAAVRIERAHCDDVRSKARMPRG